MIMMQKNCEHTKRKIELLCEFQNIDLPPFLFDRFENLISNTNPYKIINFMNNKEYATNEMRDIAQKYYEFICATEQS